MPLYMWEMWDVTPVTNGRTDARKVESRAVFSLSWIRNKSQIPGLRIIFRCSAFLALSHIFVMKQNQLSRAINNLGTDLQVSKHWWPENILDSKEICGIVGFDISAWFKEMERETRILLLLLLLQLPSNVHSIGQGIHTRSAFNHNECISLDCTCRSGLDAKLFRHILEEADALGANCLLVVSDRELL